MLQFFFFLIFVNILCVSGQNGLSVLPMPYYAGVPWYPPGGIMPNGTPSTPGILTPQQNGNTRPNTGRPPSPAGSQNGNQGGPATPGPQDSVPTTPYQVIPAYYDTAKGALVQLTQGTVPPVRLLPSPAPHLPHAFSTLSNPVNLGSPISSISSSTFGGRRDSLDRTSNPPFSPSLDHFTKTKGGWGGGISSYGAVGSIASPGLAGLAGSTGSLTPPPSLNGLNLGLFSQVNRLAPGADRTFALGGGGIFPGARTPTLGANTMGAMGTMGAIPFGSLIAGGKSRHNSSSIDKNSNRSRLLEDFR